MTTMTLPNGLDSVLQLFYAERAPPVISETKPTARNKILFYLSRRTLNARELAVICEVSLPVVKKELWQLKRDRRILVVFHQVVSYPVGKTVTNPLGSGRKNHVVTFYRVRG